MVFWDGTPRRGPPAVGRADRAPRAERAAGVVPAAGRGARGRAGRSGPPPTSATRAAGLRVPAEPVAPPARAPAGRVPGRRSGTGRAGTGVVGGGCVLRAVAHGGGLLRTARIGQTGASVERGPAPDVSLTVSLPQPYCGIAVGDRPVVRQSGDAGPTALAAVVFDVDGTLVDSERDGHRVAFNQAFADFDLPVPVGRGPLRPPAAGDGRPAPHRRLPGRAGRGRGRAGPAGARPPPPQDRDPQADGGRRA